MPLVALLFWLSGTAIARQVLQSSYNSPNQLQADTQLEMKLSVTVLMINAEINQSRKTTTVSIKTTDSNLKRLEYEFLTTEPKQVEALVVQEIGLPVQEVRRLARYRVVN